MKNIVAIISLILALASCTPEQKMRFQQASEQMDRQQNPMKYAQDDAAGMTANLCNVQAVKTKKDREKYQDCYRKNYTSILQVRIQQVSAMQQQTNQQALIQQQQFQNQMLMMQVNRPQPIYNNSVHCNSYASGNQVNTDCY